MSEICEWRVAEFTHARRPEGNHEVVEEAKAASTHSVEVMEIEGCAHRQRGACRSAMQDVLSSLSLSSAQHVGSEQCRRTDSPDPLSNLQSNHYINYCATRAKVSESCSLGVGLKRIPRRAKLSRR
jgi:hypothetical protein